MCTRGGYLMRMFLLLALTAGEALSHNHNQQQQQQQRIDNAGKRLDNDYGPVIHISSAVLQLVPDEQTQLLLTLPSSGILPPNPGHEPRQKVSDNLDFQAHSPNYVRSHG